MTVITKSNFSVEVEESTVPVFIDLYAEWCAPCNAMKPIVEELEKANKNIKFCKINVEKESDLAKMFKVNNIPMFAVVKDNVFIDFTEGYTEIEELQKFIDKNI